ncbi:TetR family transcriptional regulator [Rhizobium sp. SJZ105]|uniref:TetR/AcrR family transcriptional regulator n=1 Tax=Rhizobium sp. SJZ105 TaxID=2572678 RepID=UPI0011AC7359|nr:TetR/AcrR family transcriptional regulator [Rhizobium sp. SJZ105]TWC77230.1 TetR family transcriptional regulator [Rhizobium sp. SJZ105]
MNVGRTTEIRKTLDSHGPNKTIREIVAPGGLNGDESIYFGASVTTLKGRERVTQILESALEVIVDEGFEGMSLRSVARKTGITIGNLQHYYGTHEGLLQAVTRYILYHYFVEYDRLAELYNGNTEKQFEETIRFLIDDCKTERTNAVFFSLWAMSQRSDFVSEMMDLMYTDHRRSLEKQLIAINPEMSPERVPKIAALIAVQIEGLMLLISAGRPKHAELQGIEEECMRQIMRIAHQTDEPI